MNIRQKCEYCGNTSGKVDSWGGSISCGAQFKVIETNRFGDEEYLPAPYLLEVFKEIIYLQKKFEI